MVKCHLYLPRLIIKTELQLIANILEKQRFYKLYGYHQSGEKTINQNEDTALINLIRLPRGELVFDALSDIVNSVVPSGPDDASGKVIPETVNSWCELIEKGKTQQQIKQSLMLSAAEDCRDGYIYVFAKAKDAPNELYSQVRLFKEYQVIHNIDFDRIGIYEIDLAVESGRDRREELLLQVGSSANTEAIDISDNAVKEGDGSGLQEGGLTDDEAVTKRECTIELPYNYLIDDGGHVRGSFEVYVFFSDTQLSWPRIQKLGGMDPNDHRLKSESLLLS